MSESGGQLWMHMRTFRGTDSPEGAGLLASVSSIAMNYRHMLVSKNGVSKGLEGKSNGNLCRKPGTDFASYCSHRVSALRFN